MTRRDDAQRLTGYCRGVLPLAGAESPIEYSYRSLALCVIDTVWSIGVRYESVRNVIQRYCAYLGTTLETCSVSLIALTDDIAAKGVEYYTDQVFQNQQRTSSRSGILKSEAVDRYARTLRKNGIVDLETARSALPNTEVERQLAAIPGHHSGVSFKYFLMLSGAYNQVKPDRMILRFLETALGRVVTIPEAEELLMDATRLLRREHSNLDARLLDNLIWNYQREISR